MSGWSGRSRGVAGASRSGRGDRAGGGRAWRCGWRKSWPLALGMPTVLMNGRAVELSDARVGALDAGLQHAVGLFETMLGGVRREGAMARPWVMDLDDHLARLGWSARELGLMNVLHPGPLRETVLEAVRLEGEALAARGQIGVRVRVRLTVTGGDLSLLPGSATKGGVGGVGGVGEADRGGGGGGGGGGRAVGGASGGLGGVRHQPTVLVVAQPATVYPAALMEQGVLMVVAGARANPWNPLEGHKTLSYWWRLRELQLAGAKGAGEALVLAVGNHITGGCVSNLFVVRDGELLTPMARGEVAGTAVSGPGVAGGVAAGTLDLTTLLTASEDDSLPGGGEGDFVGGRRVGAGDGGPRDGGAGDGGAGGVSATLPGVTRRWAVRAAAGLGVLSQARAMSISDVLDADEVFLTNSSWGVLGVRAVEAAVIGAKRRGGAGSVGGVGPITRALMAEWHKDLARTELM